MKKTTNWKTIKAHKNDLKKKQLNRMADRRKQMSHFVKEMVKLFENSFNNIFFNSST
jgi:hypothetical protein